MTFSREALEEGIYVGQIISIATNSRVFRGTKFRERTKTV